METGMIQQIINAYHNYRGSSYYILFFFCALMFLLFSEKKKTIRLILVYSSVFLVVLFMLPPFAWLVTRILGEEIYYRTIWLFPIGITISYCAVKLISTQQSRVKKVSMCVLLVALFMYGGAYTYQHSNFTKAENSYHLPQVVIDLCDLIKEDGMNVKAAFPRELVTYVRQYDSTVLLAFGREKLLPWFGGDHELHYALQDKVLNTKNIVRILREQECKYLILNEEQKLLEPFSQYGFQIFARVQNYVIYLDEEKPEL